MNKLLKLLSVMLVMLFSLNIVSYAVSFEPIDTKESKENDKTYITKHIYRTNAN